jgi:hypothetical protein
MSDFSDAFLTRSGQGYTDRDDSEEKDEQK